MLKKILLLITALLITVLLSAQEKYQLGWNFSLDQYFTVDKITRQEIKKNGKLIRDKIIRDYIILLPYEQQGQKFLLKGNYYSYLKDNDKNSVYYLEETYPMDFAMDKNGSYYVASNVIMPSIRNIPYFPEKEIAIGETWTAPGIEILEFNPPITLTFDVNYQLTAREKKFQRDTVKITFHYNWNNIARHAYPDIPYKFQGSSYHTLWYDLETRLPLYTENKYDLIFMYKNNDQIQYKGDLTGYYNLKREIKEKEKVQDQIYDQVKKEHQDLNVKKSEQGVIIDFSDIYFNYNDHKLTGDAREKLKQIGQIITRYKDLSVIIKGHTDNIGSQQFNLNLSQQRAKSVLDFLLMNKYITREQSAYTGVGETEPAADNAAAEGRRKNRRVEIIINPE